MNVTASAVHHTPSPALQDQAARAVLHFYRRVEGEARRVENALLFGEISRRSSELAGIADRLRLPAGPAPAELLLNTATTVSERAQSIRQVAEGFRGPFLLFVIGMGKHGKSSLINALIGAEVAPIDQIPKTWKIDIFSSTQPAGQVRIVFRDGQQRHLSVEEAKRLMEAEEQRRLDSDDRIDEEFRRQSKSLKHPEEKEELKEWLRSELLYRSPICEVRWPCHSSPILQHFDIVDTPGLIQELDTQRLYHFRDYYHKAHGVLWMLDATALSSRQSRQLIIRFPARGWSEGRFVDELVSNIDVFPTVLDLLRIPKMDFIQGVSFAPIVDSKSHGTRNATETQNLIGVAAYERQRAELTADLVDWMQTTDDPLMRGPGARVRGSMRAHSRPSWRSLAVIADSFSLSVFPVTRMPHCSWTGPNCGISLGPENTKLCFPFD
jgi:GTPase SAR1 family protein